MPLAGGSSCTSWCLSIFALSLWFYGDAAQPVLVRGGDGLAMMGTVLRRRKGAWKERRETDGGRKGGPGRGGAQVGSAPCSLLCRTLWPELPLAFSCTYFSSVLSTIRSELR